MTYAEKTVQAILDILNSNGTQAEMIKEVEKAMQAQRRACADVFEGFGEFTPLKTKNLKQAILNAEVQP